MADREIVSFHPANDDEFLVLYGHEAEDSFVARIEPSVGTALVRDSAALQGRTVLSAVTLDAARGFVPSRFEPDFLGVVRPYTDVLKFIRFRTKTKSPIQMEEPVLRQLGKRRGD